MRLIPAALALLAANAHAALVATYDAGTHANPTASTGWVFFDGTGGNTYQAVNDGGTSAWEISDSLTGRYYYLAAATSNLAISGWRLSMQLRTLQSFDFGTNYNSFASVNVQTPGFGSGTAYDMVFGIDSGGALQVRVPNAISNTNGVTTTGPVFNVGGDPDGYHWFELLYAGPGALDGVRLYIDGALVAGNLTGYGTAPVADRAYFGNGTVQGYGGARYAFAEFEAVNNPAPVGVPEPGTITLCGAALALHALARRRPRS